MIRKMVNMQREPKLDYTEKFRQNQPSMGAAGSKGANVAAPTVIRHLIGATGKPEASIIPGFKK